MQVNTCYGKSTCQRIIAKFILIVYYIVWHDCCNDVCKPVIIRYPVVLSMSMNFPPMYTEKKQEYEVMFRDNSTLLTTRPNPLYECLGGRALVTNTSFAILQTGSRLVPL